MGFGRARVVAAGIVVLLAGTAAGCDPGSVTASSTPDPGHGAGSGPRSGPDPTGSPTPECPTAGLPADVQVTCLDLPQAEDIQDISGELHPVFERAAPALGDETVVPYLSTLAEDATLLADRSVFEEWSDGQDLPAILPVAGVLSASGLTTYPAVPGARKERVQLISADRQDGRSAWITTSSTNLIWVDWKLYSTDGSATRVVADSGQVASDPHLPYLGVDPQVSVAGQDLVWTSPVPRQGGEEWSMDLLAVDADGGSIRTVVRDVARHASDRTGGVFFARADSRASYAIGRWDAATRQSVTVVERASLPGRALGALAAHGPVVAWSLDAPSDDGTTPGEGSSARIVVLDTAERRAWVLTCAGRSAASLSVFGHLVAWGSGGSMDDDPGEYLVDLDTGSVGLLGRVEGNAQAAVAGRTVAWLTPGSGTGPSGLRVARLP